MLKIQMKILPKGTFGRVIAIAEYNLVLKVFLIEFTFISDIR